MGKKIRQTSQTRPDRSATALSKSTIKSTDKQTVMLRRRLRGALNRIHHLKDQNTELLSRNSELLDTIQAQKIENAAIKKESFKLQQLYHASCVTINSYEIKFKELSEGMGNCLREIGLCLPSLVTISDLIVRNKARISTMRTSILSPGQEILPRINSEEFLPQISGTPSKIKPAKHRVGPMVRGMPITKPNIVLERIMLPQQGDQVQATNDEAIEEERNHDLTTIEEENDDEVITLQNISHRPRRGRLGRAARMKKKDNVVAERQKNEKERLEGPLYSSDSSESEINHSNLSRSHLEPVVRVRDVSRLLQNSSFIKVDSEMNDKGSVADTDAEKVSRRTPRMMAPLNCDDPLEGSSWMFQDEQSLRYFKNKNSKQHVSDSSDDENNDSLQSRIRLHSINTPFSASKNKFHASSPNNLENNSNIVEPDSTNHIETHSNNSSASDNVCSVETISNNLLSRSFPDSKDNTNFSQRLSKSYKENMYSNEAIRHYNLMSGSLQKNSIEKKDSSIFNEISEGSDSLNVSYTEEKPKRVRKPKNISYPGEDEPMPKKKKTSKPRLSVGRKSSIESKRKGSSLKCLRQTNDLLPNKTVKPSQENKHTGIKNLIESKNNTKSKKKSVNKSSLITPRNSSITNTTTADLSESTRSSRRKQPVSYKEPSGIKKMRRS